ncbi:hypothetical protein U14_01848 [Candidatus Moduliflexus flocculans]|uniref:Uncharacterized protein n=1 Tax=Candidatus Moduliflexus flocculans TaxID=1499966 RepID=A0A0S6VT87_9BACT|nr:hypothetical protein U14_01848 [Candidatus Moduliflexus flocculans]
MTLTAEEKERVIELLENMYDAQRAIVLATLDAFASWLMNVAHYIYQKIKNALQSLWAWIKGQF